MTTETLAAAVNDLMAQTLAETARAERFLQVLYRLFQDERIDPEVRKEYVHRATAANRGPEA
jgi:oligoendopeptidase F